MQAAAIHGDRSQGQRQRALDAFATGHPRVLVATDVAARGIHVDGIELVVHFDPPNDHKDYLHRSGRTAKAGESGLVVTLAQREQVRDIGGCTRPPGVQPRAARAGVPGSPGRPGDREHGHARAAAARARAPAAPGGRPGPAAAGRELSGAGRAVRERPVR